MNRVPTQEGDEGVQGNKEFVAIQAVGDDQALGFPELKFRELVVMLSNWLSSLAERWQIHGIANSLFEPGIEDPKLQKSLSITYMER